MDAYQHPILVFSHEISGGGAICRWGDLSEGQLVEKTFFEKGKSFMSGDMLILWLVIVGIFLVVDAKVSAIFEAIAEEKGHDGYFWWCFVMGPAGWAMVIALPDRGIEFPDYSKLIVSLTKQQSAQSVQNVSVLAFDDSLPEL